jgi:hypothetical protein
MTVQVCRQCREPMFEDSTTNSLTYWVLATLLGFGGAFLAVFAGVFVGFASGIWGLGAFAGIAAGAGIIAWVVPRRGSIDVWLEHQTGHTKTNLDWM